MLVRHNDWGPQPLSMIANAMLTEPKPVAYMGIAKLKPVIISQVWTGDCVDFADCIINVPQNRASRLRYDRATIMRKFMEPPIVVAPRNVRRLVLLNPLYGCILVGVYRFVFVRGANGSSAEGRGINKITEVYRNVRLEALFKGKDLPANFRVS